jgi:DNA-binding response OmpR family regulator
MKIGKSHKLESLTSVSLQCQPYLPGRILMVDDDPYLRQLNAEGLRRHGYEVNMAADGETGWEELQCNRYNLLITENDLPRLTGVGLVKKLRSACMPLPVIMAITTLPTWQSAQYPWLLHATKLLKPYTLEELLGMVKKILPTTTNIHAAFAPPPHRQSQAATIGMQLR